MLILQAAGNGTPRLFPRPACLANRDGNDRTSVSKHAFIAVGVHDVIGTKSRHFVAPLGVSGIMLARPAADNLSLSANVSA
jgi:hypothetical protein